MLSPNHSSLIYKCLKIDLEFDISGSLKVKSIEAFRIGLRVYDFSLACTVMVTARLSSFAVIVGDIFLTQYVLSLGQNFGFFFFSN